MSHRIVYSRLISSSQWRHLRNLYSWRAAPRLSCHFSTGCKCLSRSTTLHKVSFSSKAAQDADLKSTRKTPFLQAFRTQSTATLTTGIRTRQSSNNARTEENGSDQTHSSWAFPRVSRKVVGWWLLGSAISVYGIVVFGALTRLTESGLSITEWRPITGTLPPLSPNDWEVEFAKYRASPEFKKLNPNMNLAEFKQIFWMEYIHRLWGRTVGLTFAIPTIYFIARRRVSPGMARNLLLINVLIGLQGAVGWWMVKSGLKDDLFAEHAHPRVSQYRLAAHLGLAFAVYASMFWNGMAILRERHMLYRAGPIYAERLLERLSAPQLRIFRRSVVGLALLVATTALSGALVAGLDAGLIYNDFPYMGMGLTPPRTELWDAFYSRLPPPYEDLWWRNMLENPSLVQLDHRILAVSTFTAVHALFLYARFNPGVRVLLTPGIKTGLSGLLALVWMQAVLGISTLIYLVPTPLAATHQAGSLALLTGVLLVGSRVWTPPRLAKLVRQHATRFRRLREAGKASNFMPDQRKQAWVNRYRE